MSLPSAPPPQRTPACVHVDLDGARHIYAAHGWTWSGEDRLFLTGLDSALQLFDREAIRATLFVIAEDLDDPAKLARLREAVSRGHEVASHTWTHRRLGSVTGEERHREIAQSRERIADVLGAPVRGFRAPGFDLDAGVLEGLAEAGYMWDSSLFGGGPVPLGGIADTAPFRLATAAPLWELPLPRYRPLPVPWHASYSLVLGRPYFRAGLARVRRSPDPLMLLFHLTDFAEPVPAAHGLRERVFTLSFLSRETKITKVGSMLALVRRTHRILPTSAVIESLSA